MLLHAFVARSSTASSSRGSGSQSKIEGQEESLRTPGSEVPTPESEESSKISCNLCYKKHHVVSL